MYFGGILFLGEFGKKGLNDEKVGWILILGVRK